MVVVNHEDETPNQNTGIVGDNGQVYLSGLPETGSLTVRWGNTTSQYCRANFNLAMATDSPYSSIRQLTIICNTMTGTSREGAHK
ncbi:FimD/PapC C-terminal domain-containing protein [Providencia rettgeri]|uniref:FimD/PapC C-terminal domain-containing protein n=1 Tax=Providencia rettgeri TaxID=587 RepID=UPI0020C825B9|nr:FimD/PapC C-terminal domain-containing protein [Providencia rettgeri]